jgi:hypothetical protein
VLVWHWGEGELQRQHHPSVVDGKTVLIYDNRPYDRNASRLVEVYPIAKRIVWEFWANPEVKFSSGSRGGAQRLPNGNTLITAGNRGSVFEIDPKGKIVWKFRNPEFERSKKKEMEGKPAKRGTIFRLRRIVDDEIPYYFPQLKRSL